MLIKMDNMTLTHATTKSYILCVIVLVIFATIQKSEAHNLQPNVKHKFVGVNIDHNTSTANTQRILWIQHMKSLRNDVKDCVTLTKDTIWNCFKKSTLRIFDGVMKKNVIPIWDGVRFVRLNENRTKPHNVNTAKNAVHAASVVVDKVKGIADGYLRKDLQHLTWFDHLAMSLESTLTTHVLQINLDELSKAFLRVTERKENHINLNASDPVGTARLRRNRQNMIITMMFGVTALGAILIPMGFQVLSVVSGKALLLAKMALLLASINGLKRVANSGIHYGLYHVPGEQYAGYYDRGDNQHPRNVATVAVPQPVEEFGIRK